MQCSGTSGSFKRWVSLVWSSFMIVAMLGTATLSASAQSGNTYTTPSGAHTVVWGSDWTLDQKSVTSESGLDAIMLRKDVALLQAMFFPSGMDLVEMRGVFTDGFRKGFSGEVETMDSGSYSNVAYEFDRLTLDGVEMGMFLVLIDRGPGSDATGMMFGAPVKEFESEFGAAQRDIHVDGESIFKGVDPCGLQGMIGAPSKPSPSGQSQGSSRTTSGNTSARSSGQTYTNPSYGYTVTYAQPWQDASGVTDIGDFSVYNPGSSAIGGFVGLSTSGMQEVIFFDIASAAFLEGLPAGADVVDQVTGQSRILLVASTSDGVFIQEYIFLPGNQTAIQVTLLIQGRDVDAAVASFQASISVNGSIPLTQWELVSKNL